MRGSFKLAIIFLIALSCQQISADREKLLIYYGYPSLFNGSTSLSEAVKLFDNYDIVVLAGDLVSRDHEEHGAAERLVKLSKAEFYGYVDAAQPIEKVCSLIKAWAEMGVKGVMLDDFGFDYLEPMLGSRRAARLHQARAMECAREHGLKLALNFWFPEDVFEDVDNISLDLSNVSVLVEHAVYGFGNKTEEYIEHFRSMLQYARRSGAKLWCLTSTSANSSHANRIIGYDALTILYPNCDAYAIQEDYGEDSSVFYAFSRRTSSMPYIKGADVVLWGRLNHSWYISTIKRLRAMGFDSLMLVLYLRMPSVNSSYVEAFEYTPTDDELRYAVSLAKKEGFRVFLRPSLIVEGGWSGEIRPADIKSWFESYSSYLKHYASLAEELKVYCFVIGTELSSLDKEDAWRGIITDLRRIYSGNLSYSANFYSEVTSFWDLMDFIGVDAYYPVENSSSWDLIHESRLEPLQLLYGKPIIFTEIGYRSGKGAGSRPWDWQSKMERGEEEQDRLWRMFLDREAWRLSGFFYWAEAPWGDDGTGYSVLGKMAETSMKDRLVLGSFDARGYVDAEIVRKLFSGARVAEGSRVVVGGPFSNPEARIPWISFGRDYMYLNGSLYRSSWGKLDYGVIVSWKGKVYVMGTHRFGTEAALIYLKENPLIPFALVRWQDLNSNGRVDRDEIELVKSA